MQKRQRQGQRQERNRHRERTRTRTVEGTRRTSFRLFGQVLPARRHRTPSCAACGLLRRMPFFACALSRRATRIEMLRHGASNGTTLRCELMNGGGARTIGWSLLGNTLRGRTTPTPSREDGRRHLRRRPRRSRRPLPQSRFLRHLRPRQKSTLRNKIDRYFLDAHLGNQGISMSGIPTSRSTCRRRSSSTSAL